MDHYLVLVLTLIILIQNQRHLAGAVCNSPPRVAPTLPRRKPPTYLCDPPMSSTRNLLTNGEEIKLVSKTLVRRITGSFLGCGPYCKLKVICKTDKFSTIQVKLMHVCLNIFWHTLSLSLSCWQKEMTPDWVAILGLQRTIWIRANVSFSSSIKAMAKMTLNFISPVSKCDAGFLLLH